MRSPARIFILAISSCFLLLTSAFGQKATLEADIKGIDGRPARTAELKIERQDKKVAPMVAKANWRGHLVLTDLEMGTYNLTATVEGGVHSSQTVKITASKNLVAFDLSKSAAAAKKTHRRFVWVDSQTGSRLSGHWVEVGGGEAARKNGAQNVDVMNAESMDNIQRMRGFHAHAAGGE